MIEGLNTRCNIGPLEITRSPHIELVYRRRAVLTRAEIEIPDLEGKVRTALAINQAVRIRFGYRGEANLWHEWQGTIESIDQPEGRAANADAVLIRAVGQEKALLTTVITESFNGETAQAVATRLLGKTGLAVGEVKIPADVLPHQIFSAVTAARAIKQLEHSLTRSFGHDLRKHAVWLGQNGLKWSDGDEPGAAYNIETAENLINHTPPEAEGEMGVITSVLLPGLTHSMKISIRDVRRQITETVRAEEVIHLLEDGSNSTTVRYGKSCGWG